MGKQFEVLAVEKDLEATAKSVVEEGVQTFIKKVHLFDGHHKELKFFEEGKDKEAEAFTEDLKVDTTVKEKLDYLWLHLSNLLDCVAQKEVTNTVAKADVIVDGVTILKAVPATLLLNLETRLKNLRNLYLTIPTLTPGVKWEIDKTHEKPEVYKAVNQEVKSKTKKETKSKILVDATKEHPAQIDKWYEEAVIGNFYLDRWSGRTSPAQKSNWIGRIDALLKAVKKARQRANDVEVINFDIAKVLYDTIHIEGEQ